MRGTPPLDRSPAAALSADDFVAGTFTASDGTTLPYRLLAPAHIEPGRRYPLVVQFHGSGAIGTDNRAQIERDFAARAWAIPAIRARHPAFVLGAAIPDPQRQLRRSRHAPHRHRHARRCRPRWNWSTR